MNTKKESEAAFYKSGNAEHGEVKLKYERSRHCVRLCIHWPFDLNSDEWTDLSGCFASNTYSSQMRNLFKFKNAVIHGFNGTTLYLRLAGEKVIEMGLFVKTKTSSESFTLLIMAEPRDLIPNNRTLYRMTA